VLTVRRLGPEVWRAARAVAVLRPLGAAVPRLTGDVLGLPVRSPDDRAIPWLQSRIELATALLTGRLPQVQS
jgi:hypothetical protein